MRTRISLALCAALFLLSSLPGAALAQSRTACARDVTVVGGDTLTGLANTYLDDPLAYNRIIAATNAAAAVDDSYTTIDDEGRIVIGWKLCIPGVAAAAPRVAAAEGGGPSSASGAGVTLNAAGTVAPSDVFTFDGEKLTIDYLREQQYPGSDIVIEETLDPGCQLRPLYRLVPFGGSQAVCAADRAAGRAPANWLAGHHLQSRLYPA